MRRVDYAHTTRLVFSVLLGGFSLLALWAVLGQGARAALLQGPGTELDPQICCISRASDLPHYGPAEGERITKTVFFPNTTAGVIPPTSEISDMSALTQYLPIVMRNYPPFVNGDFEDGLRGWNTGQGPFSGHGSGLPQSVAVFDGGHRALLGEPSALDDSIPVGYGTVAQTFTLDKRYVGLQYWVFSYDIARGSQRYYDTFEVSVNRSPDQISSGERDTRGCASTVLNPEGTLAVSGDGLVFCGGRPGTSGQGTLWDTQTWKTVTLDLSALQGTNITLYFTIWSREYDPSFYNDRAWFNTWAYVDNVQLTNSILGTSASNWDSQSPDAPADTDHTGFPGTADSSGPPRR